MQSGETAKGFKLPADCLARRLLSNLFFYRVKLAHMTNNECEKNVPRTYMGLRVTRGPLPVGMLFADSAILALLKKLCTWYTRTRM